MVREFYLVNEYGKTYSLMDIENFCLLTDPDGLGYSYSSSYERVGNVFVGYSRLLNQQMINGVCNFNSYDNYKKLIDFIEKSSELKLIYKVPSGKNKLIEYRRNINIQSIGKTEKQLTKVLSCPIIFESLSLWYTEQIYSYKIEPEDDTVRWDFKWPSKWMNYNTRKIDFNNEGHTEAPFVLQINGVVENPKITIYDTNNNVINSLEIPILINSGEKFIYSSVDNNIMISKENSDGTTETLFKQEYIDLANDNIFKLPIGQSSITVSAEQDVEDAVLTIYPYYKSV